ncbi:hypothetical protein [Robertmurraya siralis]|uniref:hypothetical protein n=1 Tax=Robertmurraya siralis TaxID=77777 RepID=UPI001F3B2EE2|nr:hypothetical protein [Robertmurraya siralis]
MKKLNNDQFEEERSRLLPTVKCPKCSYIAEMNHVLTAQSNQNVIYKCPQCHYEVRNIHTSKG